MPAWHAGIDIREILRYLSSALEIAVVIRICASGVARRFPFFLALLGTDMIGSLINLPFSPSDPEYRQLWIIRQPIVIIASLLAANELIRLLCEGYPKFDATRRRITLGTAAVGAIAAALLVWSDVAAATRWEMPWLQGLFVARRAAAIAISTSLLAANLLFAMAPAPARRNSIVHSRVFAIYVVSNAVGYFAMLHARSRPVQNLLMAAESACFLAWTILISHRGDTLTPLRLFTTEEAKEARLRAAQSLRALKESIREDLR